ncbi:MAG: hypothetical protein GX644_08485, partial [Limnobacter sp.]|nr:hypothetical protein [Limnobacter sp.]
QASADGAAREALELRLDSDENLVRILTVHKSKGLEFPFVFLPFAWQGRKPKAEPPLLHHIGPDSLSGLSPHWQAVLELGERADERAAAQVVHEAETESVRRLYVALTRAEQRCYLLWGPARTIGETPLGRLLAAFDDSTGAPEPAATPRTVVDDPFALAGAIERWRDAAPGEVDIVDCDAPTPTQAAAAVVPSTAPERLPQARDFDVEIGRPWIRTSFSAIVARASGQQVADAGPVAGETEPQPDRDQHVDALGAGPGDGFPERAPVPASAPAQLELRFDEDGSDDEVRADAVLADRGDSGRLGLRAGDEAHERDIRAGFPAGARAGACLHAILEHADFQAPLDRDLVAGQMQRAGFGEFDAGAVAGWLDAVIDTPLIAPDGRRVVLRGLRAPAVVREMDFHLSARGIDERELFEAVAAEYPLDARAPRSAWDGLLRGFVDMVFERNGRWYVLDWKSNRLGDDAAAYTEGAIDAAMSAHAYSLQACLYLLVLHRLLRQRLPGYDWDRHVGGAFWVFLRGVRAPARGQRRTPGVHASKPSRALIERLDRLFQGALDRAHDRAGR